MVLVTRPTVSEAHTYTVTRSRMVDREPCARSRLAFVLTNVRFRVTADTASVRCCAVCSRPWVGYFPRTKRKYVLPYKRFDELASFPIPQTNARGDNRALVVMLAAVPLIGVAIAIVAAVGAAGVTVKRSLDTPSRPYAGSFEGVGQEYDAWTDEGILEAFWGEHIHLGYYDEPTRRRGWWRSNFKQAKYTFVSRMLEWSGADATGNKSPRRVLDVGCGFGGTSRILAKHFPNAQVEGITLSKKQVERGRELAVEQKLTNVRFRAMDALQMEYPTDSFDLVWACESGEHMPDKQKYIEEMTRVLAPGGTLVIACWCQRETPPPLTAEDQSRLDFLYREWSHPFFISIEQFARFMKGTAKLKEIRTADWTRQTIASWRHSILVGFYRPWVVIFQTPKVWWKVLREIVCLERMHRAFRDGLMTYGMMCAVKK